MQPAVRMRRTPMMSASAGYGSDREAANNTRDSTALTARAFVFRARLGDEAASDVARMLAAKIAIPVLLAATSRA
jgi:hypothetical protein